MEETQKLINIMSGWLGIQPPKVVVHPSVNELNALGYGMHITNEIWISPKLLEEKNVNWIKYTLIHELMHIYFQKKYPNIVYHHTSVRFLKKMAHLCYLAGLPKEFIEKTNIASRTFGEIQKKQLKRYSRGR